MSIQWWFLFLFCCSSPCPFRSQIPCCRGRLSAIICWRTVSKIGNGKCRVERINLGVWRPTRSVFGPTKPTGRIVIRRGINHHCYSDDIQTYLSVGRDQSIEAILTKVEWLTKPNWALIGIAPDNLNKLISYRSIIITLRYVWQPLHLFVPGTNCHSRWSQFRDLHGGSTEQLTS